MVAEDDVKFDFLPQLPKSNLDDRTFDDLVSECILRIPRYCPEWTDYNPSDPGITLIELFAWLTDQMLLRFNKIPLRNYITFLELLGIKLKPPTSAQTELTFYITEPEQFPYKISSSTEVGTERTEDQEAIVFTTDQDLLIGQPKLAYFITAPTENSAPPDPPYRRGEEETVRTQNPEVGSPRNILDNNRWIEQREGGWEGLEQLLFEENPQPGNCFYLVFEPEAPIPGNVIAVTFKGRAATPTGINPDQPPRKWQAWDGEKWVNILIRERDDYTRGFSFDLISQSGRIETVSADVVLHLPQKLPSVNLISNYSGRWVRCIYDNPEDLERYTYSPRVTGINVRSIGGTITASHCTLIENEVLGVSDGTPGQKFRLSNTPILARRENEQILVIPPGSPPQTYQEVENFAFSRDSDRHYTLDSLTGVLQFGPLIQEPSHLVASTQTRASLSNLPILAEYSSQRLVSSEGEGERQYGTIPPRGAEIRMKAYRTGGGRKGNVESNTLRVLKTSTPYINSVINYKPAIGGTDPESLEQVVIRVPKMLRNRDRAVTKEDFELLTITGGGGKVARALCLTPNSNETENQNQTPGTITILVVRTPSVQRLDYSQGIHPDLFKLDSDLETELLDYLNQRKLLGVQIRLAEPEYAGVSAELQVGIAPQYNTGEGRELLQKQLREELYRFLNPITGGKDGQGWSYGTVLYISDIIALLQQKPEITYLGQVLLYRIAKSGSVWQRQPELRQLINPGTNGLICSWSDFPHLIRFVSN
jgi:predicted phage baseplate assembly protein